MTTGQLKDRAVLVKFSDRVWLGGLIDKDLTRKVQADAQAQKNIGHFWKRLVPTAALAPRVNAGAAARDFHNRNTLPWMEGGIRILPIANYDEYMRGMRKLITEAEKEEGKFIKDYPTWIDEAKRTHGTAFDESAYPTAPELKHKFGISIDVIPLPNVTDWRVELADDQVKELRKAAQDRFAAVQAEGIAEMYTRLKTVLEHVQDRLGSPDRVFRDSLIKNVKDLAGLLGRLNVTGDKKLEAINKEISTKIGSLSTVDLRGNPEARTKAAKDAGDIMKKMAAYMGKK